MRQTHVPPDSDFSSDLGHFILKILKNDNFQNFQKKNLENRDFWAEVPPKTLNRTNTSPSSSPAATPKSTGECLLSVSASRGPVFRRYLLNGLTDQDETLAQEVSACDLFFHNILS